MGYGSAAALAAIRYAFSIGVHRIYAETCPENNASWKTMEKLYQNEKDPEMKQAYFEMYEEMKKIVPRDEWAADWEICLKDGTSVGGIGFKGIPNEKGEIEVGYGIDPEHQRNGYATEAVGAMMKWAFDQEDVIVFQGQTEPHNEISKKVLRKNGLVEVGMGYEGPLFEIRNPKRK